MSKYKVGDCVIMQSKKWFVKKYSNSLKLEFLENFMYFSKVVTIKEVVNDFYHIVENKNYGIRECEILSLASNKYKKLKEVL